MEFGNPNGEVFSGEVKSSSLDFSDFVGQSDSLKKLLRSIARVAPTDASVLILGETGTGKELVAKAIHRLSGRVNRAFVKMNSSAIPAALLEAELFGHERGAFTGAVGQRTGRFELAHLGTLFLDEIGDMPLELQPKLLRVVQESEFERLGSSRTQKVDVRLVTATNQDLLDRVNEGEFRRDLYYRLNVFPIRIPPLRERRDDIPRLVEHFVRKFSVKLGRQLPRITADTMDVLQEHDYPGNVRELENIIERSVILSGDGDFRVGIFEEIEAAKTKNCVNNRTLEDFERHFILQTLGETNWQIGGERGAATKLGLKRTTLISRMGKLGISRPFHEVAFA